MCHKSRHHKRPKRPEVSSIFELFEGPVSVRWAKLLMLKIHASNLNNTY
jgi:hypothetical protein